MTPSGIEPATFRFVAQYLNHCATISGPQYITVLYFEIPENLFCAVLLLSSVGRSNGIRVLLESRITGLHLIKTGFKVF
jgi:hypothetical protein